LDFCHSFCWGNVALLGQMILVALGVGLPLSLSVLSGRTGAGVLGRVGPCSAGCRPFRGRTLHCFRRIPPPRQFVPEKVIALECLPFVQAISQAGIPFGVYANAGDANEGIGWAPAPDGPGRYADYAQQWIDEQATLIGSCCGTSPAIIAELSRRFAY